MVNAPDGPRAMKHLLNIDTVFRGLAGVANGGITSLVMMIVSDVVSLQERGKYQGFLGSFVGLGKLHSQNSKLDSHTDSSRQRDWSSDRCWIRCPL